MKEHSGGTPEIGHISLSSWDEESFVVPIEHFKFDELDKPGDFIAEIVARGEDCEPTIKAFVEHCARIKVAGIVASLLDEFLKAKNPRMIAHQIVWAIGMTLLDGESAAALAKRYGVSKQAFEQGALRVCSRLDLRPCRNMRGDEAKKNMSKRNFRK